MVAGLGFTTESIDHRSCGAQRELVLATENIFPEKAVSWGSGVVGIGC